MSDDANSPAENSQGDGTIAPNSPPAVCAEYVAARLREAGLDTERFIDVHDGSKGTTSHTKFDAELVSGNYGIYANGNIPGGLVDIDIDDYDADLDKDAIAAVNKLPATLTVETPHTDGETGGHRFYAVQPGEEFETAREACEAVCGATNPAPTWGEVRVENQYVVGPGSSLNGCNKEWCHECASPSGGRYRIAADRSIATITADDLANVLRADSKYTADRSATTLNAVTGDKKPPSDERVNFNTNKTEPVTKDDSSAEHEHPEPATVIAATGVADGYDPDGDRSEQDWAICKEFARHGVPRDAAEQWFYEHLPKSKVVERGGIDYGNTRGGTWTRAAAKVLAEDGRLGTHTIAVLSGEDSDTNMSIQRTEAKTASESEHDDGLGDLADRWRAIRDLYQNDDTTKAEARDYAVRFLNEQEHFLATKDNETLYRYDSDTGIYYDDGKQYIGAILDRHLGPHYSTHERNEVVMRLKDRNWIDREEFGSSPEDPRICVANGILDLTTGNLDHHTPDEWFIRRLPVEYNPDADCPAFDAFLDDVVEKEQAKRTIYEVLGLAIHPGYLKAATLMMYGDGRNGKSTLLDVVERFLDPDNISNRSLQALEYDDFAAADLYGKLANICGDLPSENLSDTGMLKTLTGGDHVTANPKYKQPFSFRNEAVLIFSANDPPEIDDESTALARRLLLVNCPNEFTPPGQPGLDQRPKHELMADIANDTELSGILNRAVEAIQRVRETGQFSRSESVERVREQYKRISNPVYAFAKECVTEEPNSWLSTDELYACYVAWCDTNDTPKKAKNVLPQLLMQHVRMEKERKSHGGRRTYGYRGITLTGRGEELHGDDDRGGGQTGLT